MFKGFFTFSTGELVTIGLFAGAAKAASLMVALAGGGMNPLTLILKNAIWAALWLILLVKVQKPGTLTLANLIAALFGLFLMGSSMLALPAVLFACVLAEALMSALSGFMGRLWVAAAGIAVSELLAKGVSLGIAFLGMREQAALIIPVTVIISVGYLGILAGLAGGVKMVKELRHAGLIRN
jgi:energy-coupling factor transport system substrate-specific component